MMMIKKKSITYDDDEFLSTVSLDGQSSLYPGYRLKNSSNSDNHVRNVMGVLG